MMLRSSIFLSLLFATGAIAQKKAPQSQAAQKLYAEVDRLRKDPDMAHASWGLCVMKAAKDTVIASYNPDASLVPASSLKVLTTGAALALLGPKFRYETLIQYQGKLDTVAGVLNGDLVIKGSGDPSLASGYFKDKKDTVPLTDKWAAAIRAKGIRTITGAVIGDDRVFESEMVPATWIWGDMGNYYGAGACGLSFMDNKYTVYFNSPAGEGQGVTIAKIVPEVPGLRLQNLVVTGGSKDNAYIYGAPYSYDRYVTGTIPAGRTNYDVEGSMPDPAWYCAWSLARSLEKAGVKVTKPPSCTRLALDTVKSGPRTTILKHLSPELEKIVHYTNMRSNNLYAESLLKTIAFAKTGYGDDDTGIGLVTAYWASKGVDVKGIFMNDGSGLSRANAISAKAEAEVLRALSADSVQLKRFMNTLPFAGAFAEGTAAEKNMRFKSGYITRARSYAGYVKNPKGELLVFSLIFNNYDCGPAEARVKMEKLMLLIAALE